MRDNKILFIEIKTDFDMENSDNPIYEDILNIIEDENSIGFTNNDDIFLKMSDNKALAFCRVLDKYDILYRISDVSAHVINGDAQKKYPEVEELTPDFFGSFRLKNTSINNILDKISERGLCDLDKIDICILELNIL